MSRRRTRPAPAATAAAAHPAAAAGDVFRGKVVPLDELEATLNGWYAEGFTDLSWELLGWGDAEPWSGPPRAFAWAWRE